MDDEYDDEFCAENVQEIWDEYNHTVEVLRCMSPASPDDRIELYDPEFVAVTYDFLNNDLAAAGVTDVETWEKLWLAVQDYLEENIDVHDSCASGNLRFEELCTELAYEEARQNAKCFSQETYDFLLLMFRLPLMFPYKCEFEYVENDGDDHHVHATFTVCGLGEHRRLK